MMSSRRTRQVALIVAVVASLLVLFALYNPSPAKPARLLVLLSENVAQGGPILIITNPCSVRMDFAVLPYEYLGPDGWRTQTVAYPLLTETGSLMPHESRLTSVPSPPANGVWRVAVSCRRRMPVVSRLSEYFHRYPRRPFHEEKVTGPEIDSEQYKRAFDTRLAQAFLGRWALRGTNFGPSGVLVLSSEGCFVSVLTNSSGFGYQGASGQFAYEGTWEVRGANLTLTCTKSSEQEARAVGTIERFKLIRLNEQELVVDDLNERPPATKVLARVR